MFTSSFFFYFSRRENMETRLLYLKESVYLTFICTPVAGGFSPGFNYIAWSTSALVPFHKYFSRADSFLTPAWLQSGQKCAITVDELSWKRCKYSVDATSREVGVEKEPLFFPFVPVSWFTTQLARLADVWKEKGRGFQASETARRNSVPLPFRQIQSDLILWDLLRRQNSVAETKIFTKILQYTRRDLSLRQFLTLKIEFCNLLQ